MPYDPKQYNAAVPFFSKTSGDDNVVDADDLKRIRAYSLYEDLYVNSADDLRLTLRGDDQYPIIIPNARKIIEATWRFLGVGFDYFVENSGDSGTQTLVEQYMDAFFKRERVRSKYSSNKRWGLIRADAVFYLYGNMAKAKGERVSLAEINPRQVFLIEDKNDTSVLEGCHIVTRVADFRPDAKKGATLAQRRTFRRERNELEAFSGKITTELTHWEIGTWDDRQDDFDGEGQVRSSIYDEDETYLPETITQLPVYIWRNNPMQNCTWGVSQLTGLETVFYAINQSITDEDATIVFQGLGMYVTNAKRPRNAATGQEMDWTIGPGQIIEIGAEQEFTRVSGVSDVSPYTNHMDWLNEKGLIEASGTPAMAIGRVDVATAQSGISLKMELMPLLAANAEKEAEFTDVLDQMFHDLVHMWLPAYEPETFDADGMADISVVCIFDDPMPVDHDAAVQETLLLRTSNLILTSMAVSRLRELGWEYPTDMTDDEIVDLLNEQAKNDADNSAGSMFEQGGGVDEFGNPIQPGNENQPAPPQTIPLGV